MAEKCGRKCMVCTHASRLSIEQALRRGLSHARVAATFDVSVNSVRAHLKNHMPLVVKEEREKVQKSYKELCQDLKNLKNNEIEKIREKGIDFVIREVLRLYKIGQQALQRAQSEENCRSVFMGIREIRELLKFYVDLWAMFSNEPITIDRTDVISSEEWRWLEGVILDVLKDEPEMRNKLSVRLLEESQISDIREVKDE